MEVRKGVLMVAPWVDWKAEPKVAWSGHEKAAQKVLLVVVSKVAAKVDLLGTYTAVQTVLK